MKPNTAAHRQLDWYLQHFNSDMSRLTVGEAAQHLTRPPQGTDDELRKDWAAWANRVGRCTVAGLEQDDETRVVAIVETTRNTRQRLTIVVEEEAPHRIAKVDWQRLYDFQVTVRKATEADGPALAEIERHAPIAVGNSRLTFDRSADYLAAARLMEDAAVVMAEVDGVPAAVEWAALHRTRIGGHEYRLLNFIHLRVAAEHQRKGLWGALVHKLNERYPEGIAADGDYACAARDNASIQHAFAARPRWRVGPIRALLRAAPNPATAQVGRAATPDDAARIAELLNDAHGREEMFLPYTADALRARLERAPELYSWEHLRLTDSAVVGVWPAGSKVRVLRETDGHTTESRHGLVLDYGYRPGAEQELQALLGYWGDWLATRNHTHLSIFTSEPSPSFALIAPLADQLERFDLWTSPVSEPETTHAHGVYMDQVYF